jgi:hypothetical protein
MLRGVLILLLVGFFGTSLAQGWTKLKHTVAASNSDREWVPSDRQTVALERAVSEYFERLDDSRFGEMYELFTLDVKKMIAPDQYHRDQIETWRTSGALKEGSIKMLWDFVVYLLRLITHRITRT